MRYATDVGGRHARTDIGKISHAIRCQFCSFGDSYLLLLDEEIAVLDQMQGEIQLR